MSTLFLIYVLDLLSLKQNLRAGFTFWIYVLDLRAGCCALVLLDREHDCEADQVWVCVQGVWEEVGTICRQSLRVALPLNAPT